MGGKTLRPDTFDTDPSDPEASKKFQHWLRCSESFINSLNTADAPVNKLEVLIQLVSHTVYDIIEESSSYDDAIKALKAVYIKTPNILYARHSLITRRQKDGEGMLEFLTQLKILAKQGDFKAVTAEVHKEEYIREAFVSGLRNVDTKRKILESSKTKLDDIVSLAQVYEEARENAEDFAGASKMASCNLTEKTTEEDMSPATAAVKQSQPYNNYRGQPCTWCGHKPKHPRERCPARDAQCGKCGVMGHWAKVCQRSSYSSKRVSASVLPFLASLGVPSCLKPSVFQVGIGGRDYSALFDTGSGLECIRASTAKMNGLKIYPEHGEVAMANATQKSKTEGFVQVTLTVHGKKYPNTKLTVLPDCITDIILGQNFLFSHGLVKFEFPGNNTSVVSSLGTLKVEPPELFKNLTADCHPIASKSRRYTAADKVFIREEVSRLLKEGIIEKSKSPWRAQLYVAGGGNQKKRLTVDYSETINRFTLLDAYPLPRINEMVNEMAQYRVFSTIDLKSAYHQIPLREEDKPYTAFEANGGLYQFCRVPFGVTNGVAVFQRQMDSFVEENSLSGTFPYLDNITICGRNQTEHDENLKRFLQAAKHINLTYNEEKCEFSTRKLHILGSVIENGEIRPDPKRLEPLSQLKPPSDAKSLKRVMGFFSYYSKWIKDFSKKISLLVNVCNFPLNKDELYAFESLKREIGESVVCAIDENAPFTVECDASNSAIAATLNQSGRPVAFFSRTLRGSELKHASVEKEAQAIIESVRYWRHFLTGRHFVLVTDQKSVSFMFNTKHPGKIKNEKIMRWRMELLCYSFDIVYRPGSENIPPDTFSRECASLTFSNNKLKELHESLCHPGVTRMTHFVKTRNLPYSIEEIRKVNNSCKQCCEVKPRFYKPEPAHLIKATQPFERLNLDFKGPLPSVNANKYFLHIVDEYSRFPFVFPVANLTSSTVISCLNTLFSTFGMPAYIHSDRGSSFMSNELKLFLNSHGISSSRTTPYNPAGNGQVEKGNHTVWRAISLTCHSRKLPLSRWQEVLPDVLHSTRTLLCTATNCTPHERMFNFQRRSGTGTSLPTWLASPGKVLLRRFVRHSKNDPWVDEVDLIEANPQYAHIRYEDGRESTVSLKDLTPSGQDIELR